MTDNGLAALATALVPLLPQHQEGSGGYPHQSSYRTWTVYDFMAPGAFATAILGPRGVFLPDGLGPVMVGMAKEIATLRAALEEITKTRPASWNWADSDEMDRAIRIARSALVTAKETQG